MSGFTTAVPVLPVSDLVRAMAWYERLGFGVRATFEGYAIVAFDDAEVHLNEIIDAPPATETYAGAYLRVADADVVHAHWSAMGARIIAPPEDQPYGIREFATEDLDGNLWRVGAPIGGILTTPAADETRPAPASVVDDPHAELLAEHSFDGTEAEPAPGAAHGSARDSRPREKPPQSDFSRADRGRGADRRRRRHQHRLLVPAGGRRRALRRLRVGHRRTARSGAGRSGSRRGPLVRRPAPRGRRRRGADPPQRHLVVRARVRRPRPRPPHRVRRAGHPDPGRAPAEP